MTDIDELLDATAGIDEDPSYIMLSPMEIDLLLDRTRNWQKRLDITENVLKMTPLGKSLYSNRLRSRMVSLSGR